MRDMTEHIFQLVSDTYLYIVVNYLNISQIQLAETLFGLK